MPGWKSLIVCGTKALPECEFGHLILLVQNLIHDLVILTTIFATIGFAYAGFILLTSGGSPGKKDEAKKLLMKVLWGYVWILVAWLLVYTIANVLLDDDFNFLLGDPQPTPINETL